MTFDLQFYLFQGISRQFTLLLKLVKDHQDQYEDNNSSLNKKLAEYTKQGWKNMTILKFENHQILNLLGYLSGNFSQTFDLSLPSVETFLPNTINSPNSFTPAFKISWNRAHVSIVLGKKSISTLQLNI